MQLDHIAIYAYDIDVMRAFYEEGLGFKEISRTYHNNGSVKMIRLAISKSCCIELFNFDANMSSTYNSPTEKVNSGFMHVGIGVDNLKELYVLQNKSCYDIFQGQDNRKHIFLLDPEGNQIEFTLVEEE